jgi:hypothetical protein
VLTVKVKTGNWGLTKGVIAVDPYLGKIEKFNNQWCPQPRVESDLPLAPGVIQEIVHKVSLREIIIGLQKNDYRLVISASDIKKTNRLIIEVITHNLELHPIIFSINFNEPADRIEPQQLIDFKKMQPFSIDKEQEPSWWLAMWGEFHTCLSYYYPLQYKYITEDNFHDVMIYGVGNGKGEILPITGDQDLLWISIPTSKHDTVLKNFEKVINTFEASGTQELYTARIALHLALGGNPEEAEQHINNDSIAGLGCVTPYESYVIDEVNTAFAKTGIKHLRNLIQHAPENHNPGKPSPLNATMVHIWRGEISLTLNENELIQFVMQPNYPRENIFHVHPQWNMKSWAPVVANQCFLKQPILEKTLLAYNEYCNTHKTALFSKGRSALFQKRGH